MLGFIDSLWLLISAIIAIVILGLAAGFSPTLYVTQIGMSTTAKRARNLMIALMIGVLLGIVALSTVFQFFQLDALRTFIDSAVSALFVSIIFNIIIGVTFILAGFWYINKKPNRLNEVNKPAAKSSYVALISLGFLRTFASISGATATFLASGIISDVRSGIVVHLILTAVFLAAAIAPFLLIVVTIKRYPKRIQRQLQWFKDQLLKYNYKIVIGAGGILIGGAIIIFNLLQAVTF